MLILWNLPVAHTDGTDWGRGSHVQPQPGYSSHSQEAQGNIAGALPASALQMLTLLRESQLWKTCVLLPKSEDRRNLNSLSVFMDMTLCTSSFFTIGQRRPLSENPLGNSLVLSRAVTRIYPCMGAGPRCTWGTIDWFLSPRVET